MFTQLFKRRNEPQKALSPSQVEELINTIRKTVADEIADKLKHVSTAESNDSPFREVPWIRLSPREKIVLEQLVQGKSNKEIGVDIYLSEGGVKNVITNLLTKFKLQDRTQLAVSAVVNNMVAEETLSMYKKQGLRPKNDPIPISKCEE